ncbi:MAG: PaaX family transcriptional regulator C-terminal domain-containing protein [Acidimicrobiales bacterium]
MRRLSLAELREGTWLRPANLDADRLAAQRAVVGAQCTTLRATPDDDPRRWPPSVGPRRLARDARALADERWRRSAPACAGDTEAMGPAFVASAAVLRHLLADPLLPDELVPADWPGAELRSTYDEVNVAFLDLFGTWLLAQR